MPDADFPPPKLGSIGAGLGLAAVVNWGMLMLSCATLVQSGPGIMLKGFGLIQLIWMIPIWMLAKKYGGSETAKGVLIGIGITLLLSAACWGVFVS